MRRLSLLLFSMILVFPATAQFSAFRNKGLVGVGRISANSFDAAGTRSDTLGGIFSALAVAPARPLPWRSLSHRATLYALPDRGFGDGATNYRPRVQVLKLRVVPYDGTAPTAAQNQISLELLSTLLLTDGAGQPMTGFDPAAGFADYPRAAASSIGLGRQSVDAEGIALRKDGSFYVSDEYGPFLYHFDRTGKLMATILPPAALLPRAGAAFGSRTADFGANDPRPDSGRNDNRGLEGLSLTPDERRLVAVLQSPTIQDSGSGGTQRNNATNTRILVWDVDPASANRNKLVAEYIFQISITPTEGTRHTPVSEILAINDKQFLILERDGYGRGQTEVPRDTIKPALKSIVMADATSATNLAGTGYDLERGDATQTSLPFNTLPAGVTAVARLELINMIDEIQLAKFGLNVRPHATSDANSISEKWEGMALLSLNDPTNPDDYLLLVGNDNDFKAAEVVHNGVAVGTNAVTVDNMLLAWRVTIPGFAH